MMFMLISFHSVFTWSIDDVDDIVPLSVYLEYR